MLSKVCSKCKVNKKLTSFSKHKNNKDGLSYICKECSNRRCRKWSKNNKLHLRKYKEEYHQKNKIKHNKQGKLWYDSHKNEMKEYRQNYKIQRNKRRRYLYKFNLRYRIEQVLRSRTNKAIKNNSKSTSTMFLVGCDIDYLMYYLQCKFQKSMTWDNHGTGHNGKGMKEWQIDHIKPCTKFDLSKTEEQRRCFHYTNLQPLWAEDNLKKWNTYVK